MTRVTRRDKLLIYRPFSRDLFSRGGREGPSLLLRHLRGEQLDWAAIEAKYTPRERCSECNYVYCKEHFQTLQWNRKDQLSVCKACVADQKSQGTPFRCNICGLWKSETAFACNQQHGMCLVRRVCADCIEKRQCSRCHERKEELGFTPREWEKASQSPTLGACKACMSRNRELKTCSGTCGRQLGVDAYTKRMWRESDELRRCLMCMPKCPRGHWKCIQCKDVKLVNDFSEWLALRTKKTNDGTARCNVCKEAQRALLQDLLKASSACVVARSNS